MNIKEKDNLPNSEVFILEDGEPIKKNIENLFKNKKVVMFGLPGAYTSVCSAKHLPGYVNMFEKFKEKGIDQIICISVNDPFVMNASGKENKVEGKILMMGDPFLNFTKAIGADVDKSGRGLGIRSNRYTMLVDDMKVVKLQEEKDTGSCEMSAAADISQEPVSFSSCNLTTFISSTSIVYLFDLIPRPLPLLSTSAPIALVKFRKGSPIIKILPSTLFSLPDAFITNGSLTEIQIIWSIPFSLNFSNIFT